MKKILFFGVFLVFAIICSPTAIFAEKDDTTTINITVESMDYIKSTQNHSSVSGTNIYSSSATTSTILADTIGLRIYLQAKNLSTGSWSNTGLSREFLDYSSSSIYKSTLFSVTRGYQYRIKIVHFVKEGSTYNSQITYSSIIDLR